MIGYDDLPAVLDSRVAKAAPSSRYSSAIRWAKISLSSTTEMRKYSVPGSWTISPESEMIGPMLTIDGKPAIVATSTTDG
jgi:hypothetical protein